MIYLVSAREFRRYLSRASQLGRGHPRLGVDLLQRHAVAFLDGLKRGRSLGERERASGLQVSAPPRGNAHTDGVIHGAAAVLGSEPVGLAGSGFSGLEDLRGFALQSGCSESGAALWAQDQLDALQLSEDRYRAFSFGIYEGLLAMLRPADAMVDMVMDRAWRVRYSGEGAGSVTSVLAAPGSPRSDGASRYLGGDLDGDRDLGVMPSSQARSSLG